MPERTRRAKLPDEPALAADAGRDSNAEGFCDATVPAFDSTVQKDVSTRVAQRIQEARGGFIEHPRRGYHHLAA